MPTYKVIYDVGTDGISHLFRTEWPAFLVPFILFVAFGLMSGWGERAWKRNGKEIKVRPSIRRLLIAFFVFMAVGIPTWCFADYWTLRTALNHDKCDVVEGRIANFSPMPIEGHKEESFTVDGVYFHYSDYALSAGFNNASSMGGPVRDGLQVRIHFLKDELAMLEDIEIAKLEVAEKVQ